jgi:DNA-binding CsgD family transcriptional regulator
MTMKVCHEGDDAVCTDAIAELRSIFDGEGLAPTDASYADARDRWGTRFDPRSAVAPGAESSATIVEFSRYARGSAPAGERRMPMPVAPAPRTERFDLRTEIERLLAAASPELAAERFLSAILTAGLAATLADHAKDSHQREMTGLNGTSVLTRREREVASLIASGRTNRSIANELFIAQSTVERHVANMLNKLGFHSRTQIAAWAVTNGIASAA